MKSKTIILTIGVLFFSVFVILGLHITSYKLNHKHNTFTRLLPPHPVLFKQEIDIKYNSYYFAGATSHNIYLGNFTLPLRMLKTNYFLSDTIPVRLTIDGEEKIRSTAMVSVDSPNFYLMDGITPKIMSGNLTDGLARRYTYDSAYFTSALPISHSSFIIRSLSSTSNQYVLGKETNRPPFIKLNPGILEKQVDGMFCVDGILHYEPESSLLVYIYYYRNQFICMDTSLNIKFKSHTIDTVSHSQIKVNKITSENKYTFSAPPLTINKTSCVYKNWLLVHSTLLAKNENEQDFNTAAVIDVYDLENNGIYQFSFYIQDIHGKRMEKFIVTNNKLLAMHDRFLTVYDLVPKYFNRPSL